MVVSAAVLAVLVVGVVALSAFLAQTAFHLREVQGHLDDLHERQVMLTDQVAHLSSPGAVAKWARQHDMVMPASGDVHILPVPGSGG
jgi:cell division protein FtsB